MNSASSAIAIASLVLSCVVLSPVMSQESRTLVVPATALEGTVERSRLEESLPGQIFWLKIRETASRIEKEALLRDVGNADPDLADVIAAEFRRSTLEAEGLSDATFIQEFMKLRRLPLAGAVTSTARLKALVPSTNAQHMRNPVAHRDSPACDLKGIKVRSLRDWLENGATDEPRVILTTEPLDLATLKQAQADGVLAFLASRAPTDIHVAQTAHPYEIAGCEPGTPLPMPVVFVAPANALHLDVVASATRGTIDISIATSPPKVPASVVSYTLRGTDSSRRIVVVASRGRRPLCPSSGSRAVALATMLEVARVLSLNSGRTPLARLPFDLEFVHVLDSATGWNFLDALHVPGQTILGVLTLDELASAEKDAERLFVGVDANGGAAALERAAAGMLVDWRHKPGAWRECNVHTAAPETVGAAQAGRLGQERVPVVRLFAANWGGSLTPAPVPSLPVSGTAAGTIPETNAYVGSPFDTLTEVFDAKLTPAVLAGRAMLITLVRTGTAFGPAASRPTGK